MELVFSAEGKAGLCPICRGQSAQAWWAERSQGSWGSRVVREMLGLFCLKVERSLLKHEAGAQQPVEQQRLRSEDGGFDVARLCAVASPEPGCLLAGTGAGLQVWQRVGCGVQVSGSPVQATSEFLRHLLPPLGPACLPLAPLSSSFVSTEAADSPLCLSSRGLFGCLLCHFVVVLVANVAAVWPSQPSCHNC